MLPYVMERTVPIDDRGGLENNMRLALRWAGSLCTTNCCFYHQHRPVWRRLGCVTSPFSHNEFHRYALSLAQPEAKTTNQTTFNILIAGSADYGLVASVMQACDTLSLKARVTLVDRCATPLLLSRRWAKSVGRSLQTLKQDIFELQPGADFDIIFGDLVLSEIPGSSRPAMIEALQRTLKPGGLVALVNRLSKRPDGMDRPASLSEIDRFAANAVQALESYNSQAPTGLRLEPSMVTEWARAYRKTRKTYPVTCATHINDYFDPAAFVNEYHEVKPLLGKKEWRDEHAHSTPSHYIYSIHRKVA